MALTLGTRLGVYEVIASIGVGGMGEVYRATDTTLGRQVAIKILPDAFASDPERMARFEREAKTLASLNHPHIAAIYGFEKSGGPHALVMELVEGEDLSQRIARGAIPLDEALPIAKQIAEALDAAHEQGIIHRDLKPANIKLRPDGTVKVLDFGLAKAIEGAGPSGVAGRPGSGSIAATITSPAMMTGVGVILGTAAYMAPEQAKGRAVDKRADIWAFGCVLFEMLTGRRPFDGEDMTDVLGAVVRLEPPWDTLPSDVPPPIRTLLQSCLVKDARRRVGDISTALFVLDKAASLAAPAAAPHTTASASAPASRGRLPWMVALAVAAVVIAALVIPALRHLRETPPPALAETRLEIVTPATDQPTDFALSPDDRQIVFVAAGDGASRLWRRSLATTAAEPLAGTDGARLPFWAPDSLAVGFFADGQLKRIDMRGGAPQTVAPAVNARGGTWNADGVILFAPNTGGSLVRVAASGGAPVPVTTVAGGQSAHRLPSFLPDGRHFLFYAQGSPDTAGIYLGDAPDSHRLTAADAAGVYWAAASAPAEGWLLWVRAGTLVAQHLDVARAALTGDPLTLANAVAVDPGLNVAAVSISASGPVAYRTGAMLRRRQLTWVDRSGQVLGPLGAPDENGLLTPNVSPDGRRVAVSRVVQGNADVWLLDGARTSRFTFDAARDDFPLWSRDGRRIVFVSIRGGAPDLYVKAASGAGAEERLGLVPSPGEQTPNDWSADGRFLLYSRRDSQTDRDLWVLPLDGDRTPWVFLKTPFSELAGTFSPDGRWVAYQSNESGRAEIYIRPFVGLAASGAAPPPSGGQWQVSTAGGSHPRWRRGEIYYLSPTGVMMAVPIAVTGATLAPGAPVALFPTRVVGGGGSLGRQYDVSGDGRFLLNTVLDEAAAPITLLTNWQPDATASDPR